MFGMFGIGGPFLGNMFFDGGFGFIERGVDLRSDVSSGMWRGAMALCNGLGSMPYGSPQGCRNYIGNLIDWRRACAARSRAARKKGDSLPPGANSPSHGTRGRSYLNQNFYNGSLKGVDQEDVIKSVLGQNADPAAKDAFKKKDNIVRAVVKEVVDKWLHDPKIRGQFLRKWEMAKNDGDRARALLDPLGNGDYLQTLAQIGVPGAMNEREDADTKWQKIADWFNSQVEGGVLNSLGAEAENITRAEGWEGDAILDQQTHAGKSKSNYISDLVDKGYTNEEAKAIMSPGDMTGAEAEEIVRNMNDQRQSRSLIDSKENDIRQEKESLNDKVYNKKENAAQKRQKEEQIRAAETELARMKAERAKQYLQDYMKVAKVRFGKTAQDFGYEAGRLPDGVADVGGAVAWAYSKLGRNFVAPAATETQSGTPDNTPASPSSSGSSSPPAVKTDGYVTAQGSNRKFYKLKTPVAGTNKDDPNKTMHEFKYALRTGDTDTGNITHYCDSPAENTCIAVDKVERAKEVEPKITNEKSITPITYNNQVYSWEVTFKDKYGKETVFYAPDENGAVNNDTKTWVPKSTVTAYYGKLKRGVKEKIDSLTTSGGTSFEVDGEKFEADVTIDPNGRKVNKLLHYNGRTGQMDDWTAWYNS